MNQNPELFSWVSKLHVNTTEEEDGGLTISVEWDDEDPDLAEWTSWGAEGQRAFVLEAIRNAVDAALTEVVD